MLLWKLAVFFFTWSIFWRFLFLKVYRANFSNGIIWCVSHVFRSKGSKFGFVDDEIVISEIVLRKTTQSQSCVGATADCVESLECSCLSSFVWRICVMSKCMLWNRLRGCVSWTGCPVAQLASNRIRTHFSEDSFCHSNTNNTRQET